MSLTFFEESHRYQLDGKTAPSVTTIISGGIPKPGLMYWAANQAAKAATQWISDTLATPDPMWVLENVNSDALYDEWRKAPIRKRDKAAIRGTAVHKIAEGLVYGDEIDVPDQLVPYVTGYANFLDKWNVTPILTERSVANRRDWWVGRFDLIASIPSIRDGQPIEIDIKTSSGVYADTALQTAAYAWAEFYVNDDDPETEHPLPNVAATYVAHVTDEGTRLYELCANRREINRAYRVFKAARTVYTRWNPKNLKEITS
ncbi:hypothetical protein [Devriesea agamarum]|uniref:hypothetical protein n=1 Tax=Devriesea agamarum TaxID=472569 RepID=UPI00071CFB93|nr:hypothetical protein [Devriesea agamarum]